MEKHFYRDGDLMVRQALWDSALSTRHRAWGKDCQATDIDHIVSDVPPDVDAPSALYSESLRGHVHAIVEYKHENGMQNFSRYNWQWNQYKELADGIGKPAFCNFYRRKDYAMHVVPLNLHARKWYKQARWVSEQEWVESLYKMRGLPLPQSVRDVLNSTRPE